MDDRSRFFANNLMAFLKYQFRKSSGEPPENRGTDVEIKRPIALCNEVRYWHSEDVTCYASMDRCPVCTFSHPVVILYVREEHTELAPQNFLNNVLLPCGVRADLILESTSR